jgi:hypothetical protein
LDDKSTPPRTRQAITDRQADCDVDRGAGKWLMARFQTIKRD